VAASCLCAGAAALAAGGCGTSSPSSGATPPPGSSGPPTKLVGSVAETGKVALKTPAGAAVARLHSGWYSVTVRNNSTGHAFRLVGPGVDLLTKSVPGVTLWGVNLLKGTYHYMSVGGPHTSVQTLSVS
jgi:hypothetical protein